jgi:hypothetical protein
MNDTPETNKLLSDLLSELGTLGRHNCPELLVVHARKLEHERDEAREIAHDLAVIASHCLGSHSFSLSETSERIADTLKRWRSTQPCKK